MPQKSITFFTYSFPVLSQTFVIEQINGLIELGHPINIVAIQPGDKSFENTPSIRKHDLINKTTYLLKPSNQQQYKLSSLFNIARKQALLLFSYPRKAILIWFSLKLLAKKNTQLADTILDIGLTNYNCRATDSVIAHFGHAGVIASYLIKANILQGKLFTVFHGFEISKFNNIKRWKKFYRELGHNSELLLPISKLWQQRLIEFGVPEGKIKIHHMGIDTCKFKFQNRPLGKPLNILTVARATEKKGITYALQAIEQCHIPLKYHIIGGGDLLEALKVQVTSYRHKANIIFHGPKPPEFVQQALTQADILLLPSVTDKYGDMEGIPVSLMEAMATGVIVLSTTHSGIPELVNHNISGFLVPERSAESITLAIKEINKMRGLQKIRLTAFNTVMSNFNSKKLNQQLSEIVSIVH
jgi:colanic acid/amylovoran biosynthesis glycosyltransferase